MTQKNNDLDKINKNIYIKTYVVSIISYLIIVWLIATFLESPFIQTLLVTAGAVLVWTIFKSIVSSITFNLFFKNDLIEMYLHQFKANDFPKPQDYEMEMEEVESYLQTIAMNPDNHPKNIVATQMLSEFGNARTQGKILVLFRLTKVMKKALKKYSYFA